MRISDWSSDVCSSDLTASAADPISIVRAKAVSMLMPPRVSRQSEGSRIALFLRKLEGCARTDDVARRRNEGRAKEIARGHGEGHCDGDRLARLRHRDAARIGRNTRDPGQAAAARADRDAAPVVRVEAGEDRKSTRLNSSH